MAQESNTASQIVEALGLQNPEHKMQAHGKTVAQMKELHTQQLSGTQKKIKANKNSKVEIPECEEHLIHVSLEKREFDPSTGVKKSKPHNRSFVPSEFLRMTKENAFIGQHIEILHDPRPAEQQKVNQPTAQPTAGADVEKMNEKKLRELYIKLFGEESDVLATPEELRIKIKEKQAFNDAEAKKSV